MIIIKRHDDNFEDILFWLIQNVGANAKPGLQPVWGSPNSKKVEWTAANHTWRVVLDDKAKEISISIMDVEKENQLKEYLNG